MSIAYPLVIPPTRTVNVGQGQSVGRQTLPVEVELQSLADVRAMIRNTTQEQAAIQIRLGNPPSHVEVDGKTNKPVDDAARKTVVVYGTVLAQVAMRLAEMELASAIDRSTRAHSGRLHSTTSAWRWLYLPKGGAARPVSSGQVLPTFAIGDALLLVPQSVPYATLANRNVARSGKLSVKVGKRGKSAPKSLQNIGFLLTAARALRAKNVFKQFHVIVTFTKAHMVPGEVMTREQGTGYIRISPRVRRVKV